MAFTLGVVLFALGIGVSIALHEYGHLVLAKLFGMKVRRYYIGFGPRIVSFRRGETEYGLKAVPAGGFCDIAGMTALDELADDEVDRAMYRQSAWKRVAVMMGGPITHFLLGFVLLYAVAVGWGLPNVGAPTTAVVGETVCVAPSQNPDFTYTDCSGPGPAAEAGIRAGDVITAVDGRPTPTFADVVTATQPLSGTVTYTVERDGRTLELPVTLQDAQRYVLPAGSTDRAAATVQTVGAIGVSPQQFGPTEYNALSAVPGTVAFTGTVFEQTWQGLLRFPEKVPALVSAIGGGERAQDTPISVVGASVIGGQVAEQGLWQVFLLLLATLNFFIGVFNLLPLLPLDGGHMAVTVYERLRNAVRRRRGRPDGPPVDYTKLLPVTYVVLVLGGGITLLTVVADIVNPIKLF
ncbi:zinc metalloprotease Rip [Rhodococcus aerolatus]